MNCASVYSATDWANWRAIVGSNGTARQEMLTAQKVFNLVEGRVDRIDSAYSIPADRTKVRQRRAHQLPRLS